MRVLVTGAAGFVGAHLLEAVHKAHPAAQLLGWSLERCDHAGPAGARLQCVDIRDAGAVRAAVQASAPTHLVHLAAVSSVPSADADPVQALEVNAAGTLHLLEAVRAHAPACRFLHVSTSDIYGRSFRSGLPLDEHALPAPENTYSSSKAAADLLAQQYGHRGLHVAVARPFNHTGPGQSASFALASFARQIARIERGLQDPVLSVGNLEAERDFTDVRDVVAAYVAMLARLDRDPPAAEVFNVASGRSRKISTVLDELLALTPVRIEVRPDPDRMRPSDTPVAAGDSSALRTATGWQPLHPWERTLRDLLDYWRSRAGSEST